MSYTKGGQNAKAFGDFFVIGDVALGTGVFASTGDISVTVAHGLGVAPDWVMLTSGDPAAGSGAISYSTLDTTNITVNRAATDAGLAFCWMAGNLS